MLGKGWATRSARRLVGPGRHGYYLQGVRAIKEDCKSAHFAFSSVPLLLSGKFKILRDLGSMVYARKLTVSIRVFSSSMHRHMMNLFDKTPVIKDSTFDGS